MFEINTPYGPDRYLLSSLGLPNFRAPFQVETFVGKVQPWAVDEVAGSETTIELYVTCAPSQSWRFVVERRSERDDYDGMERTEIRTGGGGNLIECWPTILQFANGCLVIGETTPFERTK